MVVYREGDKLNMNVVAGIEINDSNKSSLEQALTRLASTYAERLRMSIENPNANSLTIELMRDPNKLVKKLFEEFGESVQAFMRTPADKDEQINELADLLYPLGIFLAINGLSIVDVLMEDVRRNQPLGRKEANCIGL